MSLWFSSWVMSFLSYKYHEKHISPCKMTWKQENNFRNGFLAAINIQIVVLRVDVVLIEPKISHYLFQIKGFSGHIGFCAHRPPGGYSNLLAVVFVNLMPIPNTMPNCKNLSPSAQFAWKSGYSYPASSSLTAILVVSGYRAATVSNPVTCCEQAPKRTFLWKTPWLSIIELQNCRIVRHMARNVPSLQQLCGVQECHIIPQLP